MQELEHLIQTRPSGVPLHDAHDAAKVATLAVAMQRDGWVGPPLVVDLGAGQAWTGSHRIAAARKAWSDNDNPTVDPDDVPVIDLGDLCAEYEIDWHHTIADHSSEYEAAAALRTLLPPIVVAYLGYDVDGE